MKRTLILMGVFVLLVGLPHVRGQSIGPSTLNAMGGSGTIGTNEFEWSIGEMTMVSTFTSGAVIVTQGVLQPKSSPVSVAGISFAEHLQVFPNPASSIVNIRFSALREGSLQYKLTDIAGRSVMQNSFDIKQGGNIQQLDISPLANAIYMLQLTFTARGGAEETTAYKIQKLQ